MVGCCFLTGVVTLLNWVMRYGLFISFQELELANVDMLLLSLRFLCAARHIRMFVHL